MTRLVKVVSLAAAMACGWMGAVSSAQAQGNNDPLSLKIANAISPDRFFIRAGVIGVKIKTESGDTYDVTGPVLTEAELRALITATDANSVDAGPVTRALQASGLYPVGSNLPRQAQQRINNPTNGLPVVFNAFPRNGITQLGTPTGIKAVSAETAGTAGLSLGYYLDDEYKWAVEAYVLAAPLSTYVKATGPARGRDNDNPDPDQEGVPYARPFGLEGQKIITTKLLPPTVIFGRYWGSKGAKFRPYTGAIAMYAVFYDTKATDALNNYVGGSSPGDTTVSLKNTFGIGPMLGLKYDIDDSWHISLNVGSVKLKTEGTIVTRNTYIQDSTGATKDFGLDLSQYPVGSQGSVSDGIQVGINTYGGQAMFTPVGGITGAVTRAIAYNRFVEAGGDPDTEPVPSNLGTYVRKAKSTLTNTIFMLSVGRSF